MYPSLLILYKNRSLIYKQKLQRQSLGQKTVNFPALNQPLNGQKAYSTALLACTQKHAFFGSKDAEIGPSVTQKHIY